MCIALDPSIGTEWSEHYLDVETQSELTRAMTAVDRFNVARRMIATVRFEQPRYTKTAKLKSAGELTRIVESNLCFRLFAKLGAKAKTK